MSLIQMINREPALFFGLLEGIIALAIGFGLNLSAERYALVMAVIAALIAFLTRQEVSPTKPNAEPFRDGISDEGADAYIGSV